MLSFADLASAAATVLLAGSRETAPRVVVSLGFGEPRGCDIVLESRGPALPPAPGASGRLGDWMDLVAACDRWTIRSSVPGGGVVTASGEHDRVLRWDEAPAGEPGARVELHADPARVSSRADEPETLFALHALAAARPEARLILRLPPDLIGRRW